MAALEEKITTLTSTVQRVESVTSFQSLLEQAVKNKSDLLPPSALNKLAGGLASNGKFQTNVADRVGRNDNFLTRLAAFISSDDDVSDSLKQKISDSPTQFVKTALQNAQDDPEMKDALLSFLRAHIQNEVGNEFDFFYIKDFPSSLEKNVAKQLASNGSTTHYDAIVATLANNWPAIKALIPEAIQQVAAQDPYYQPNANHIPPQNVLSQPYNAGAVQSPTYDGYSDATNHPNGFQLHSPADKAVQMMREKTGLDYRRIPGTNQLQIVNATDSIPTHVNNPTYREIMSDVHQYQFGSGPFANRQHCQTKAPDGIAMARQGSLFVPILPPDHASVRNNNNRSSTTSGANSGPVSIRPLSVPPQRPIPDAPTSYTQVSRLSLSPLPRLPLSPPTTVQVASVPPSAPLPSTRRTDNFRQPRNPSNKTVSPPQTRLFRAKISKTPPRVILRFVLPRPSQNLVLTLPGPRSRACGSHSPHVERWIRQIAHFLSER